MLARIVIVVAVIVVGVVVVAPQPSAYRVSRSATIAAPAPVVFAQVNDFHRWAAWSPWATIDPAMQQTFEGAPAGVGAVYTWSGNYEVGQGRMTIVESRPPEVIRVRLDFEKPLRGTGVAEFRFRPEGERTVVTWSMAGENGFVAKATHLAFGVERMIGRQFEKGLAAMATVAEAAPRP